MLITILILLYLISVIIGYFGIKRMLIAEGFDADVICFIVVFIPIWNIIWGLIGFVNYYINSRKNNKNILNKFFRLNK